MALTVELDTLGARVVDTTAAGARPAVSTKASITVTQYVAQTETIATAVTDRALPFGQVSAGKILVIKTDYALTVKLNGETTGHVVLGLFIWVDTGGSITAATITNASGSTATVEYLAAG